MDERRTDALQYGHTGTAVYLPETQSWHFSRNLTRPSFPSYTGVTKITVPSSSNLSSRNPKQRSWKGSFLKAHPEFTASPSIEHTEELSGIITTITETCDPQVSALLDFGYAVDLEHDRAGRVVPIAVVASGENGNILTLLRIEDELVDWGQEEGRRIRVPSIGNVETAKWAGSAAPIRQIRFSQTVEGPAGWMAVRFPLSTIIFRPLLHRDRVPIKHFDGVCHTPIVPVHNSRLDPNPVVEIPTSKTGGFAHVDVTFNPWYQKQFAVIDERGKWSIWNISGRQKRLGSEFAECVQSGSIPWPEHDENEDIGNKPQYDGWGAIEWVGSVNKLIVCTRRCMVLYVMESGTLLTYPVELGLRRKSEWILDIKRSTSQMSRLFILTTSRLFCLDVDSSLVSDGDGYTKSSLVPQLSWQHFRDPEDITLRLASLSVGEDFFLILYSRLNDLGLGFQVPPPSGPVGVPPSVPDPFVVHIPKRSPARNRPDSVQNEAPFMTLLFKEVEQAPPGHKGDYTPFTRLVKLFILDASLAVQESLFFAPLNNDGDLQESDMPLSGEVLRLRRRVAVARRTRRADFIVDDFDESTAAATAIKSHDAQGAPTLLSSALSWTVDCTAAYLTVIGEKISSVRRSGMKHLSDKGFKDCLENLAKLVVEPGKKNSATSQTMLEIVNCKPFLDDIDQNVRDLEWFRAEIGQAKDKHGKNLIHYLPLKVGYGITEGPMSLGDSYQKVDISQLYDRLIHDWLSVLPHDIPARTRVFKEKMIRNITAELCLARILYAGPPNLATNGSTENQEAISGDTELPDHPEKRAQIQRTLSDAESAPPEISDELAVASAGLRPIAGQQKEVTVPALIRLNSLTVCHDHSSLPKSANSVLSHWLPGGDPALYDWQKTVREEEAERSKAENKLGTPKHRRGRSQSNLAGEESTLARSSPVVPIVQYSGSQPQGESLRTKLQSSQVTDENLPMTQIERGVFGGRDSAKKSATKVRKKKRAAGF
ncbi:hypothetical protein VTN77DRAFT_3024 [Rasamsonia byssochlamydoides]|uniref:uncharacterized protein n=1 Tax=Rasamsonia byssochlamydoides TaxID=89139 RepID=UPI0037437414